FSGPKTSIICSPMTSLKTSIKTITYLSDTGCLEIQGASLSPFFSLFSEKDTQNLYLAFSCLSDRLTELLSMLTKKEQLVIRREYACHHPGG
ncbi:hypothetical protein, partial [Escherichia coli]|uniref:hypothetical protein n=1 Tax=Escherichia coli TaxID=562 RepID=UPI003D9C6E3E